MTGAPFVYYEIVAKKSGIPDEIASFRGQAVPMDGVVKIDVGSFANGINSNPFPITEGMELYIKSDILGEWNQRSITDHYAELIYVVYGWNADSTTLWNRSYTDYYSAVNINMDYSYDTDGPSAYDAFIKDPIDTTVDTRQAFILTGMPSLPNILTITGPYASKSVSMDRKNYLLEGAGHTGEKIRLTDPNKSIDFTFVKTCAKYVLHYVNAFGGWDSLLIQGKTVVRDEITRHTVNRRAFSGQYNFAPFISGGRTHFTNVNRRVYELHTHYLTEEQSEKMFHLLESTQVVLEILDKTSSVNSAFVSVTIENAEAEFKTRKTSEGHLISYTINVAESVERIRR